MKDLRHPGNFAEILPLLAGHGVECILIGGGAGIAHGLARSTYDVDVVYSREYSNLERIANSLLPFHAYLRDMPPGLPFQLDVRTLVNGMNFTLSTDLGALDLLGDIPGGANYQQLVPHSQAILAPCHSICFFRKAVSASPMALTLCFREPVGASPGPEFAGEFA